ncbi:class II aldolase/adducin family protein [Streptomyces griseoruber]|uniref:class II aldolase/adducin family protein n=1 Tax=Streptomyces griseoruber TaxID=1943 RepID=UPI00099ED866|nr:class II aldolase/adducin family protein [Streptomyces griseoruber]
MPPTTTTTAPVPHESVGPLPEGVTLPVPPQNPTVEEERLIRKQELAAAFRLFARFGFSEGVAGHITGRDPERPEAFWVNPFGMSFGQIRVRDLVLVDHDGTLLERKRPVNKAAFCIPSRSTGPAPTSGPLPGRFRFRPMWDQITQQEPDLLD